MDRLRGPASPSANEECGFLSKASTRAPALMMPYNPPYYARLIAAARIAKAKDLVAYRASVEETLAVPKIARANEVLRSAAG